MKKEVEEKLVALKQVLEYGNIGDFSDGYHTFNELYDHRAALFACLCNQNKQIAWKSRQHDDGTMFEGMFIVGLSSPYGQITYHYGMEYWDLFQVLELPFAVKFDGSTPADCVERLKKFAVHK